MQPERFGRYEVVGEIGDGAMGRVYKARDPVVERFVAIKTIKSEYLTRQQAEEYLKRFRREAQAAGSLNHPNIVRVFDVGENHIVMEMLEGRTLQQIIREAGPMDPERARAILSPVAEALDHAHEAGIIHRDIKPANIMVQTNGQPKLMDFGVAHVDATVMTATGQVLGSPSFMSPEQLVGEAVTPRSDNYSLAVVAYEMLTGQSPFPGKTITAVIYKVMHGEAMPPRKLNASLPDRYDEIFARALSKDPEARYASATDFSAALDIRDLELSLDDLVADGEPSKVEAAGGPPAPAAPPVETEAQGASESPTLAAPALPQAAPPHHRVRPEWWMGLAAVGVLGVVFLLLTRPAAPPVPEASAAPLASSPAPETVPPSEPEPPESTGEPAPAPDRRAAVVPATPSKPKPTAAPTAHGQLVELGPGVTPPRRIQGSSPRYPEAARRRNLGGSVTASMIVTEEGEPVDVTLEESAGDILDAAVLGAIEGWRFEPATKDGVNVRVRWVVRQTFKINN